ncbi:MAG: glycosyltransferase [Gaiellales bacterium]
MSADRLRLLGIADGKSLNVLRWGRRLIELGHEVHIVTDKISPEESAEAGLVMHDVRTLDALTRVRGLRRIRIGAAIRSLALRLDIDLTHAHYMLPYGYWAAQSGLHPLVMSPWSRDVFVDANEKRRGRKRSLDSIRAADYVVVNSQANQRASVELGADPSRIQEIVWYAEPGRFGPENHDTAFRPERGWPDDALVVLSLRNYRPYTHVDVLVSAFARVAPEFPKARLMLCARAGWLREEIEQLVEELGIEHLVRMERAEYEELPRYVGSADIAVTIADSDSTPASLLEVMASRLPVIAAPTWSIDEWLGHGEGAEIVPVRDLEATAAALRKLLADPQLRASYGARNEQVVRSRMEEPGPVLERLYRGLIAEYHQSRAA